jgi:hypothetical protein
MLPPDRRRENEFDKKALPCRRTRPAPGEKTRTGATHNQTAKLRPEPAHSPTQSTAASTMNLSATGTRSVAPPCRNSSEQGVNRSDPGVENCTQDGETNKSNSSYEVHHETDISHRRRLNPASFAHTLTAEDTKSRLSSTKNQNGKDELHTQKQNKLVRFLVVEVI